MPVLVWVAVIMVMATDWFSGNRTAQLLYRLLTWLFPHIGWDVVGPLHMFLRKLGHFIGYAVLGALAFRAWRSARVEGHTWDLNSAVRAVVVAAMVACGDETLQAFMTTRGGSMFDVMLDTTGASVAQLFLWFRIRRAKARES